MIRIQEAGITERDLSHSHDVPVFSTEKKYILAVWVVKKFGWSNEQSVLSLDDLTMQGSQLD